jgi:hypothetical protein
MEDIFERTILIDCNLAFDTLNTLNNSVSSIFWMKTRCDSLKIDQNFV